MPRWFPFYLGGGRQGLKGEPYATSAPLSFIWSSLGYKELDCLQSATHALRKVTEEKTTVVTEFSFLDPCNRACVSYTGVVWLCDNVLHRSTASTRSGGTP